MNYTKEEIEQFAIKARKWDILSRAISEFYLNESGAVDEGNPIRKGDLADIGEEAASRLGWL